MSNCYWLLIHIDYAEKISTQFDFFLNLKSLDILKCSCLLWLGAASPKAKTVHRMMMIRMVSVVSIFFRNQLIKFLPSEDPLEYRQYLS